MKHEEFITKKKRQKTKKYYPLYKKYKPLHKNYPILHKELSDFTLNETRINSRRKKKKTKD